MENTCNYKECKLFDLLGGDPEQCPNYMENWFTPPDGGKPVLMKDCAPRRVLIMMQELHNRLVGVQKAQEEQRNESVNMKNSMINFTNEISKHNEIVKLGIIDNKLLGDT